MTRPKLIIFLLFLSAGAGAQSLEAAFPVIDSLYKAYAGKNHIPGLAYGIVSGGQLVHTGTFGYADVKKRTPVTSKSIYRIASMTKSFTAMAILSLRDAGKLDLDDPVYKYIPEMKQVRPLTDDSPPITIRHLLSHSAGFPEDNPWGDRQLQRTDEELINFIKGGVSLSNTPGLAYEYSNLGFTLLGHIVTKVSGEPFEQYIRRTIFRPLGMEHTYWEYTEAKPEDLAHGYRWLNNQWKEEAMLHSGAYGAMGGMLTSLEDFSRYMSFHLSAWPPRNGAEAGPLKRSSVREMHQPGKISGFYTQGRNAAGELCPRVSAYNFGLSWSRNCSGKEFIGHSGGLPGFGSNWIILPEYGIGVVSFCNLTYEGTAALNTQVLERLIALAQLRPRQLPVSDILRQRQQQLMALLPDWKDAPASGIFSENFFDDYLIDSLRKEAADLFSKAGKVLRVEEILPENQLRGTFRIVGEKTDLEVKFTLSPENPARIQAYNIKAAGASIAGQRSPSPVDKYGLKTISSLAEYRQLVTADRRQAIVALDKFIPGIRLDIRYATNNNIMHRPMYRTAAAFLRLPAAEALRAVAQDLQPMGYGLKVYDGYRPYRVTVDFWEAYHDSNFVASPYTGSRHNRGCAVDLTLVDLTTGKELDMPTPYDDFTRRAAADYADVSPQQRKNRRLLQDVMLKHGFVIFPSEWWHFDFAGYKAYPVMDIPFEELPSIVHHDIMPSWILDYPPFRIAGNLYYVGSDDLACYLITTPEGHILINTGVAGSDTMIRRHVEKLGFKFRDIRILLASHAHFDHVGAMAAIKQETKAKMMMEEEDVTVLEDGGDSDFDFGGKGFLFDPVSVDRRLHDRDSILLGGMKIEVLHHPGHTKGASSFLFTVKDEKGSYRVLIANIPSILSETKLPSMPAYQNVAKDYVYTLDTMPALQFDIWFAAHASQFHLHEKHQPGGPYRPMAFADRAGYDARIREMKEGFAKRLKEAEK